MANEAATATEDTQVAMSFETRKVYLKDASFEAPSAPLIFTQNKIQPKLDIQIVIDYHALDEAEGLCEIILKVTVTSKHEEKVLYLAEVHQAGLFRVQHPDEEMRKVVVEVTCPHILLPFAREELNSLISKGGFSSFLLAPVNFENIYRSKKEKQMSRAANAETTDAMN